MLKIKSSPCQIQYLESFVQSLKRHCNITQDIYDNILISLTEAVNNAIIHGNEQNMKKFVDIRCTERKQKIVISISDEGRGFNPQNIPDPTLPSNLECCGGRGVFIMKELSDEIHFLNNGRTIEMHFNTL
ncbi:MAG: ATP-binding protein [Saprospiraceae bacterium]|nr:ATP-binding protein [Bacteroidia bacterium]MBT8230842.1 ATP-binding protein [Bacteroidia bacterium]NNF22388.1 ATP-binding protein [Saprospiraceae bacterium]NNK89640.1 ATP-binding protein [Saprospiraceae bacterium]